MEKETITVLYLDTEVQNLHAFKATYRRYFNIFVARNLDEALMILSEQSIHVFISDQRLSEYKESNLLKILASKFPDVINIIVTGHLENPEFVNAILAKGEIFRYLMKPWEEGEMRMAIEDGYKVYQFLIEKKKELDYLKLKISNNLKAPIANLEGLLSLASLEIDDTYALRDYFAYMSKSIRSLKEELFKEVYSEYLEEN